MADANTCVEIRSKDAASGKIYSVWLSKDDCIRIQSDETRSQNTPKNNNEEKNETFKKVLSSSEEMEGWRWSHQAIILLLDLYKARKEHFNGSILKKKLWEDIAMEMQQLGYNVNGPTCHHKFRNLLATYKKIKSKNCYGVHGRTHWAYLKYLDEILVEDSVINTFTTTSVEPFNEVVVQSHENNENSINDHAEQNPLPCTEIKDATLPCTDVKSPAINSNIADLKHDYISTSNRKRKKKSHPLWALKLLKTQQQILDQNRTFYQHIMQTNNELLQCLREKNSLLKDLLTSIKS